MVRSHKCNELRLEDDKLDVELIGWAQRIRDHGGKKFIDLRDREGITQIVFDPDVTENFQTVESFRREFLIQIKGNVRPRPEGTVNLKHESGEIEVLVKSFNVINECDILPFDIDEEHFKDDLNEDLRLEYRYLDLRRKEMQKTFINRHKFISNLRNYFDSLGFIDIETPFLTKSTPEGARDMLVPSRKHGGSFYALPQSPQLFKQLLMVSGFEKYYQFVKCFRDEDSRKDRQLEFTQLDIEVSFEEFPSFKNMMNEALLQSFKAYGINISLDNFVELDYNEAIEKYSSDKPDLRIEGLEMRDISNIAKNCDFSVFNSTIKRGGIVKGMRVENAQNEISRKEIDRLITFAQENGAKGMAWMKVMENEKIESSITKFFKEEELDEIVKTFNGKNGDYLFFIADNKSKTNNVLDALRRQVAGMLNRIKLDEFKFAWIVNFPLFQWDEDEQKLDAEHSPFSMPNKEGVEFIQKYIKSKEDIERYKNELLELKADCYDLTLNGFEIASGALRIYKPKLQKTIFEIIKLSENEINNRFGWFLKAYNYGAPYHRGIAFGIDRIIMILENKNSIREVMAFPKNKTGFCPLTKSPSIVDEKQLKELYIKLDLKKEKNK
jgi:aspartyl-tRNA synthetase